jgi:hypothetical protein
MDHDNTDPRIEIAVTKSPAMVELHCIRPGDSMCIGLSPMMAMEVGKGLLAAGSLADEVRAMQAKAN